MTVTEAENTEQPEAVEVEAVEAEDTVEAPAEEKKSKRPKVPEGYDTPINFAHALTTRLQGEGKLDEGEVFKPQVVYSYVKSTSKTNPFPVHYMDAEGNEYEGAGEGVRPLLKVNSEGVFEEAMAWWDAKEERKAASKAKAKAKAEAPKKEKAKGTAKAATPVVEEVDEFEAVEVTEAE